MWWSGIAKAPWENNEKRIAPSAVASHGEGTMMVLYASERAEYGLDANEKAVKSGLQLYFFVCELKAVFIFALKLLCHVPSHVERLN
jgi:hypothetical protein